jgi:hypothetical protein
MNLISYSKPYISPVDLKVKFDPMINIASGKVTCNGAIEVMNQIVIAVSAVRMIQDYMEKYKEDEEQLRKLVDDCNAGMYDVVSRNG